VLFRSMYSKILTKEFGGDHCSEWGTWPPSNWYQPFILTGETPIGGPICTSLGPPLPEQIKSPDHISR
jgi:hypothetical protein